MWYRENTWPPLCLHSNHAFMGCRESSNSIVDSKFLVNMCNRHRTGLVGKVPWLTYGQNSIRYWMSVVILWTVLSGHSILMANLDLCDSLVYYQSESCMTLLHNMKFVLHHGKLHDPSWAWLYQYQFCHSNWPLWPVLCTHWAQFVTVLLFTSCSNFGFRIWKIQEHPNDFVEWLVCNTSVFYLYRPLSQILVSYCSTFKIRNLLWQPTLTVMKWMNSQAQVS